MSGPGRLGMGALIGAALAAVLTIVGPQSPLAGGAAPVDVTMSKQSPKMTVSLVNTPTSLPSDSSSSSAPSSTTTTKPSSSSAAPTTTTTTVAVTTPPKPTTTKPPPPPTTTTTTRPCGLIFC
ncbi:hypothetical protein [Lentzea sp. NBRC 105346]|uniref:hypothetical protein n=1 Tax=Lentzea sp. NBRC 105346 TaxID=3032205 RepID=UPI002557270C|nr:hypothetical protein [Lentzea sp. NBRC 105346]